MIISVSGYGYTGSGAVLDLLKEFAENDVLDTEEFRLLHEPHGIADLEYGLVGNVTPLGSDSAIKVFRELVATYSRLRWPICSPYCRMTDGRFCEISEAYLNKLVDIEWKGYWRYDFISATPIQRIVEFGLLPRLIRLIDRLFNIYIVLPQKRTIQISMPEDRFYEITRDYFDMMFFRTRNTAKKNVVLDQLLPSNNPIRYMRYLGESRSIIVDRDPRDVYVCINILNARFMPRDINCFVKYYRLLRQNRQQFEKDSRILFVQFEDLIYDYYKTVDRVKTFLGITSRQDTRKYFDPLKSAVNTQLKRRFSQFRKEMEIIERELPEWLYPFEGKPRPKNDGEPF